MDKIKIEELKKALEQEHNRLISELKPIARPDSQMAGDWDALHPSFEPGEYSSHASLEEEADEVEEYEARLEAEHSLESRLLEVTKALERIQKGTYGRCVQCGKEIAPERLSANPAAEFDIEHNPTGGRE